jgi:hypothetical protein
MSRPALFHVTHAKAGSTWLANILRDTFDDPVSPRFGEAVEEYRWCQGTVYPAVFLSYDEFLKLERAEDSIVFYVIRDIRDSLVSLYFSLRYTHTTEGFPHVQRFRDKTGGMSDEDGIAFLFEKGSRKLLLMQKSWLKSEMPVIRYEDLIASGGGILPGFLRSLGVKFDNTRMSEAIERRGFKKVYKRELGERDNTSHGRQGLPGDWRNFESTRLRGFITDQFNEVLELAGYPLD